MRLKTSKYVTTSIAAEVGVRDPGRQVTELMLQTNLEQ